MTQHIYWHDTRLARKDVDTYFHDLADFISTLHSIGSEQVKEAIKDYGIRIYKDDIQGLKVEVSGL